MVEGAGSAPVETSDFERMLKDRGGFCLKGDKAYCLVPGLSAGKSFPMPDFCCEPWRMILNDLVDLMLQHQMNVAEVCCDVFFKSTQGDVEIAVKRDVALGDVIDRSSIAYSVVDWAMKNNGALGAGHSSALVKNVGEGQVKVSLTRRR